MEAGAGHFTTCVQTLHTGFAKKTGLYATTCVVLRWNHWDRVLGDVQPQLSTLHRDVREVMEHLISWLVTDVQQHMLFVSLKQLVVDAASHNVSRRQLHTQRVVLCHEPLSACIVKMTSFTAHSFCDEEGAASVCGVVQGGWVELYEFHVGHHSGCTISHGNTISRSYMRVGGVWIHLASTPAREHGGQRDESCHGHSLLVQDIHAKAMWHTLELIHHQISGQMVLIEGDITMSAASG
mmetsp:Transcript_8729/g.15103  ORF Transcript_8729/g.15103 Transcript_8729/m.15103 type:complete len:238 (-) Transcript_8729:980-1693(-)